VTIRAAEQRLTSYIRAFCENTKFLYNRREMSAGTRTDSVLAPEVQRAELWPIDKFVPYVRNPRKNDAAVDRLCSSIREFGWATRGRACCLFARKQPGSKRRADRMNRSNLIRRLEALELRHNPGPAPKATIPGWLLESLEAQLGIIPDGLVRMTERVRRCVASSRRHPQPTVNGRILEDRFLKEQTC
jgi:hypothetical protein